jgi:hypothetical protein
MLKLPGYPETRLKGVGFVGSSQLILLTVIVALLLCVLLRSSTPVYIIVGVVLPVYFRRSGVQIENYWEGFTLFLMMRRFTTAFAFIDVSMH